MNALLLIALLGLCSATYTQDLGSASALGNRQQYPGRPASQDSEHTAELLKKAKEKFRQEEPFIKIKQDGTFGMSGTSVKYPSVEALEKQFDAAKLMQKNLQRICPHCSTGVLIGGPPETVVRIPPNQPAEGLPVTEGTLVSLEYREYQRMRRKVAIFEFLSNKGCKLESVTFNQKEIKCAR